MATFLTPTFTPGTLLRIIYLCQEPVCNSMIEIRHAGAAVNAEALFAVL